MITKNIIVSQLPEWRSSHPKSIRGILSLTGEGNINGLMRIFNVPEEIVPLFMAIKIGDKKFVYTEINNPEFYEFKIVGAPKDMCITILLATMRNGVLEGVALGQNEGCKDNYSDLFDDFDDAAELNQIEQTINENLNEIDSLSESEADENIQEEPETFVEQKGNFYALIQPQLDELFAKFPHYKELEDLVENTEWIKVSYADDGEQHYVLGKLFEGEIVTHICYGIPANSQSTAPPESLVEYCQWLPLDLTNPSGKGYWVMYQNAENGENIKL